MADIKTETKVAPAETITMKQVVDLIPTMIASAVAAAMKGQPVSAAPARPVHAAVCQDCGQAKSGCEGKHVLMVVYPASFSEYFPGAIINGVRYLSNDPGHMVLIPEACESTILGIVAGYEKNERDISVGRKRDHNSGRVSPSGSATIPANAAWR